MTRGRFVAGATAAGLARPAAAGAEGGLRNQDGRPFSLAALRGREVALFFGYTHCPDVCPTVLATLALVARRLGPASRLQVVFVTVDPQRDTTSRMKRFVDLFDPHFLGVTGDADALGTLYRSFGVWTARLPNPDGAGYLLAHESGVVLIDAAGIARKTIPWNASTGEFTRDIREISA